MVPVPFRKFLRLQLNTLGSRKFVSLGTLLTLLLLGLLCLVPYQLDLPYLPQSHPHRDVLVLYILSHSDPEYLNNFRFFIREAMERDSRCEFAVIVQKDEALQDVELPSLPIFARYVFHDSKCYDWGAYAWVFKNGIVDIRKYRFFFFINSSVRGPFMPLYLKDTMHWTDPFTQRISEQVKLVGATMSCEGSPLEGDMKGLWRRNPHLQSSVLATDKVGLQVMMRDGKVFFCHSSLWNTIFYSELGSSAAVLNAGYNLASLMLRYQGVEWRDRNSWDCNKRFSVSGEYYYDGITLDPLEVLFVKVKGNLLSHELSYASKAVKYDNWLKEARRDNLTLLVPSNEYLRNPNRYRVPKILSVLARGPECFDTAFYLRKNPDLQLYNSEDNLWKHFVFHGQFEPRSYQYTCQMDYSKFVNTIS